MKYIDEGYVKAVMINDRLRQGNAEFTLYAQQVETQVNALPSIDICFCRECIYYDPPHVEDNGKRIEYKDLPEEAFDELGTGLVNVSYGVNIGGRCCVDYNCGYAEDKRVYRAEDNFCGKGSKALYSSEKPNSSERSSE